MHTQYFSLIKIILKILFCTKGSFSLLLILLGLRSPRAVCVARAGETPWPHEWPHEWPCDDGDDVLILDTGHWSRQLPCQTKAGSRPWPLQHREPCSLQWPGYKDTREPPPGYKGTRGQGDAFNLGSFELKTCINWCLSYFLLVLPDEVLI